MSSISTAVLFPKSVATTSTPRADLFPPTPYDSIAVHAQYYATVKHWPVFPVPLGTKKSHKSAERSFGRPWGATTDADEIRDDFEHWSDANVGIVTGAVSGIFVVEADTKEGHDVDGIASLAALQVEHGELPVTLQAISPSGSIHYFFNHPGADLNIKNSASKIAPGIDVRGDGGMMIGVPSVKPGKGAYRWQNNLPVADAPQWLLDIVITKSEPAQSISLQAAALVRPPVDYYAEHGDEGGYRGDAYIEAALRGEYDDVVSLRNGRNDQLNISAVKLGHYVASGVLDEKRVIDTLWTLARPMLCLLTPGSANA